MSDVNIADLTMEQVRQFAPKLYEQIRNDVDPNAEIEDLKGQLEAQKTTNKELSDDNEKLRTESEDLTKERDELKEKVDKFEAAEALNGKKEKRDELLKEAGLPEELVTDFFKESLLKLDEEGMAKAIEERKEIAEKTKGKVKDSGEEFDPDKKENKIDDKTKTDVLESVKAR